jgi:hypothetical protein
VDRRSDVADAAAIRGIPAGSLAIRLARREAYPHQIADKPNLLCLTTTLTTTEAGTKRHAPVRRDSKMSILSSEQVAG